ncbi:hypothetical protein COLO4_12787 [Corchorus olitorius]|uniref:Uncharacterized protein n=1 Tax=Corchorus olitorius TaxID=93759 RepID=A0A1R3JZM9_9ROSI|nr:hypothetical protein COLO4_12787 [Corchorus olitorius]
MDNEVEWEWEERIYTEKRRRREADWEEAKARDSKFMRRGEGSGDGF